MALPAEKFDDEKIPAAPVPAGEIIDFAKYQTESLHKRTLAKQKRAEKEKTQAGQLQTNPKKTNQKTQSPAEKKEAAPGQGSRFRQALQAARHQDAKRRSRLAALRQASTATRQGSGHLLKAAWLGLFETFGLTWFYIAFHFIIAYFTPFSGLFVKFGQEWLPAPARQLGGETTRKATKGLELIEIMGCLFIGFLLLSAVLIIIVIIGIIAYIYNNPLETLLKIPGVAWEVLKALIGGVQ